MARDGSGDIFLSGITSSPSFSSTPISHATSRQHSFVARVRASGDALVYLTFVSGLAGQTFAGDMVGDTAGGVILVGTTADRDLPTTAGAFQRTNANTNLEALDGEGFVTRLDRVGAIVFSTYLGGSVNDYATEVGLDPSGSIIVAGGTSSPNFPVTAGAYDTTFNTPPAGDFTALPTDTFISRLSADGSQLTYSTFFGGQTYEYPNDMVVDASGFVTIGGATTSSETGTDMPVTAGAYDSTWNGGDDGFIARFKLDGLGAADLKYSTFLGGINTESLDGLALDPTNPELVTVAGWSWVDVFTTPRFPTTAGVLKPVLTPNPPATPLFPHSQTGFVTRFRFPAGGGGSLVWSTFTGGNFSDIVTDVAVDETGAAIVIGSTRSYDLSTTRGAVDRTLAGAAFGAYDCFVQKISPDGAQLLYSTYLGGRSEDCDLTGFTEGRLVYVGGNTVAVAGVTDSPDFPTTAGAMVPVVDEVSNSRNLFVAKLHLAADAGGDLSADPPTLLSPPNGALTDYGSVYRFRWSDVPDPSGIEAYVLEVSTKPDFPANFTQYRASTPGSELILEGLATTIPWYWRVRTADRAGNLSDWSATSTFTTGLSGALPSVSMVQIYPTNIVGGQSPMGVLHLTKPAPAGGAVVTLLAKDGRGFTATTVPLAVPETVTVPAGAISANFTINTSPVTIPTPVKIYGTIAGIGAWGGISVDPPASVKPASLSLNPLTVTGGNPVTGTVTLTGPAPAGGKVVPLGSQYPEFVSVPASMTIPAGATSGTFSITTSPVPIALNATIEAVGAPAASLSLKTAGGVRLTNLTLSASSATGGANVTGTVTFSGPIPATPAPSTSGAAREADDQQPRSGAHAPDCGARWRVEHDVQPGRSECSRHDLRQHRCLVRRHDADESSHNQRLLRVVGVGDGQREHVSGRPGRRRPRQPYRACPCGACARHAVGQQPGHQPAAECDHLVGNDIRALFIRRAPGDDDDAGDNHRGLRQFDGERRRDGQSGRHRGCDIARAEPVDRRRRRIVDRHRHSERSRARERRRGAALDREPGHRSADRDRRGGRDQRDVHCGNDVDVVDSTAQGLGGAEHVLGRSAHCDAWYQCA